MKSGRTPSCSNCGKATTEVAKLCWKQMIGSMTKRNWKKGVHSTTATSKEKGLMELRKESRSTVADTSTATSLDGTSSISQKGTFSWINCWNSREKPSCKLCITKPVNPLPCCVLYRNSHCITRNPCIFPLIFFVDRNIVFFGVLSAGSANHVQRLARGSARPSILLGGA